MRRSAPGENTRAGKEGREGREGRPEGMRKAWKGVGPNPEQIGLNRPMVGVVGAMFPQVLTSPQQVQVHRYCRVRTANSQVQSTSSTSGTNRLHGALHAVPGSWCSHVLFPAYATPLPHFACEGQVPGTPAKASTNTPHLPPGRNIPVMIGD